MNKGGGGADLFGRLCALVVLLLIAFGVHRLYCRPIIKIDSCCALSVEKIQTFNAASSLKTDD